MRVLTIIFVFVLSNGEEYSNITRRLSCSLDVPDIVQLPPSLCGDSKGASECPLLGARMTGDCQCACNETNSKNIQYKGTFGYLDGQWKCQNNTVVRKHAGCLLSEDEEYDPTKTISSCNNVSSSSQLSKLQFNSSVVQKVLANNASFLGCDGEWAPLDGATISKSFHLTSDGKSISMNKTLDLSRLGGLIIRLAVDALKYNSTQCVLFKLAGHQICNVTSLPLATSSSSSSSVATFTTKPSFTTPNNSASCGDACKTPLISPSISILHTLSIAVLLGVSVLVVIVTIAVLMTKPRRIKRKHARQPFVLQMSSLAVTENNEHADESLDAIEIDQSHDDDGYLHPLDEAVPRGKEHESKRLGARELNTKRQVYAHMEQPAGPSNTPQGKNVHYYNHCSPKCKMKSRAKTLTLDDFYESSPRDGSRWKDSPTSLVEPDTIYPKQSKAANEKRSNLELPYYVLEAPASYSASSASQEIRHNTLPNLRYAAMETNRGNNECVVDEAEQVITRNAPRREKNNYEQLHFDGQECSNNYQQLCYATRKKEEE